VEVPTPSAGPTDVLVRIRACGICGSDSSYIALGGIPPREGATPLGHEPAGEVVDVGDRVEGIPTEIFQVTKDITENWERFSRIISHRFPFADVQEALTMASTPGAADKVVVTFE
jgi:threonine dehydrogenase-like Zn-dependent dehydrogenase